MAEFQDYETRIEQHMAGLMEAAALLKTKNSRERRTPNEKDGFQQFAEAEKALLIMLKHADAIMAYVLAQDFPGQAGKVRQ